MKQKILQPRRSLSERQQALHCLKRVFQQKTPLSHVLKEASVSPLTKALCFGVCRQYVRLSLLADQLMQQRPKNLEIWLCILMGLYELYDLHTPDYAAVQETVALLNHPKVNWAKRLVNAILRRYCREREALQTMLAQNPAFIHGHPAWLVDRIQHAWPQHWQAILQANDQHPPMTIRVNGNTHTPQTYLNLLHEAGITAHLHPYASQGLVLAHPVDVSSLPGFAEGQCSVQDAAAQLTALLMPPQPDLLILDACCAPGGKLGHLLEHMPTSTTLVGVEIDEKRLLRVKENLHRLNQTAHLIIGDATQPDTWWDGRLFDRILLDAPCSALGVIRRHPDIKHLRTSEEVTAIVRLQAQLLTRLWPLLAPQGQLIYATCSILPEENELQVAAFVKQTPFCTALKPDVSWGHWTGHGLQLLPGEADMDGFFYSVLKKR